MMPQHFNPALGGQQGMPQQQLPPQAQVDHHQQSVPGVLNESARAWQMNQLQSQFRQQGVGDMGGGQGNSPQVLELIRSQQFARQQQQQMQQAHQQQQFGLGGPMNANAGAQAMQDQAGHNFTQFPKQQFTPMQLQALSRNPAMLQAMQNQPGFSRQLDLIGLAHQTQQSNQGNNASVAAFRQLQQQQQQQQQQQHSQLQAGMGNQMLGNLGQGGFFNNPAMSQPSDNLGNLLPNSIANQRPGVMQQGLPMAQRPQGQLTPQNAVNMVKMRQNETAAKLQELRQKEALLQSTQMGKPEHQFRAEVTALQHEIQQNLQLEAKLAAMLQQHFRQQPNMNGANMPPQGPQPSSMMQNNQGVPSWLPHNGPSPANNFANAQHPPNAVQMPPNTPLQQNAQASHTPGGLHPHNIPMQQPPRSVPTPLSHMNNMQRNGIQSSPGMPAPMASPPNVGQPQSAMPNGMSQLAAQQQQFQQAQRPGQNQLSAQAAQIPALPAEAFKAAYGQWCSKHNIVHDEQLLQIEGKKIDLHRLHQEVIASGTVHRLGNNLDLWAIVGGRLDFVQFPGASPDDPPRSGPGVAQKLQHVYREYLSLFDSTFLRSVLSKRYGPQAVQQNSQPPQGPSQALPGGAAPAAAMSNVQANGANAGVQQPGNQGPVNIQSLAPLVGTNDPHRILQILSYSQHPADELRRRGIPDNIINLVETHRALLQRTFQAQMNFQNGIKNGQAMNNLAAMQARQNAMNTQMRTPQQHTVPMPQGLAVPNAQQSMSAPAMQNAAASAARSVLQRPPPEAMQKAVQMIQQLKMYANQHLSRVTPHDGRYVPEDQRFEYNTLFEQLFRHASDLDQPSKLSIFACYMKEEMVKRLVEIIAQTQHQRALLSSSGMPRYILDLATVRTYLQICQNVAENLSKRLMSMSQEVPQGRQQLPTHMQPSQATSPPMAPPMSDATILQRANPTPSPRPPSQQARPLVPQPPQSNVPTPQPTQPSPRTQPVQTTPIPAPAKVPKKSAVAAEGTASTSTPPASASTPANPPTPSHVASSPQTPKSPKTKAPPKPKPKRKPSVKGQQPTISVPNPPASAATPTADQSSPAAATPESGNKRKREDDVVTATPVSSDPSPSKKPKTDWEGPESEELQQKKQAVEGVKTDEDATKFLENMTEMLAMVSGEGKQVPAEISDTLDQILSNLSDSVTGIGTLGDASGVRSSTPPIASNGGDGLEYFDFSLYNEDDRGSKAPTPDLVQTSSTNPSPGSDADSSHGPLSTVPDTARIADSKIEDELDGSDPLRLSFWSEVGGGEAAYFNSDPWKWEGSMPTSDQPWAILDR